jgi:cleavage and polyadenylation specificity factor subunit 3
MATGGPTTRRHEVDGDLLEITPLGAGSEVGRSCCVVRFRGKTVMFDCGIHPAHSGMSTLPYFDHINPAEVDILLVTHFHLDHSGSVPYFVNRTEFKGKVFMTHPTRPICKLLWHDYSRVSKIAAEDQIFDGKDVEKTMDRIELVDFHEERQHRGIKFTAYKAGHVLGAAMFMINIGGIRVLYTGDYSREQDRHLPQAELINQRVHVLIVESTYGVMLHEPREQREHRFTNSVHQIVRQGGKCLMPVFALGRAQEILLILDDYWERNSDLHGIPIYYNSPMASKCLRIFETYTNMCSDSVQEQANRCNNPWKMKYIKNMPDRHQFAQQEAEMGPCVVLAAPGMMQSGASRELFEMWAPDKKNGIIVSGYSVNGTLAHDLKSEPDSVTLNDGRKVAVRATVKFISFSAHSDYAQTSEFIRKLKANVVVLVHGEEHEMGRMRTKLKEEYPDLNVTAPQNCQTVALRVPPDRTADAVGKLVEVLSDAKRARAEVPGLLVEDPTGSRTLLSPEELGSFTTLSACQVEQCQRFNFPHSLAILGRSLRGTYDDVVVVEGTLLVCDCVRVSHSQGVLCIKWEASPLADIVADSVSFAAIELMRSPSAAQALGMQEDAAAREGRLFRVLCTYLQQEFGRLDLDEEAQSAAFEVDGTKVAVDFGQRSVSCENEVLKERVRICLRRCETALRPLAPF